MWGYPCTVLLLVQLCRDTPETYLNIVTYGAHAAHAERRGRHEFCMKHRHTSLSVPRVRPHTLQECNHVTVGNGSCNAVLSFLGLHGHSLQPIPSPSHIAPVRRWAAFSRRCACRRLTSITRCELWIPNLTSVDLVITIRAHILTINIISGGGIERHVHARHQGSGVP